MCKVCKFLVIRSVGVYLPGFIIFLKMVLLRKENILLYTKNKSCITHYVLAITLKKDSCLSKKILNTSKTFILVLKKKNPTFWLTSDMEAYQVPGRAAAVKSRSRICFPPFKATGRIAVCSSGSETALPTHVLSARGSKLLCSWHVLTDNIYIP